MKMRKENGWPRYTTVINEKEFSRQTRWKFIMFILQEIPSIRDNLPCLALFQQKKSARRFGAVGSSPNFSRKFGTSPPTLKFQKKEIRWCNAISIMLFFIHQAKSLRQDPLEAILVIFGRRALIFFCLKALGKKWKMTPLLRAGAVFITLETQTCRKKGSSLRRFNFSIYCDRQKRFSQNERGRADLQYIASHFLIVAQRLSCDL